MCYNYPTLSYIKLSTECNAKCVMCDYWRDPIRSMNRIEATKLVEELVSIGCQEVRFTGGEPFMYPYLNDLLEQVFKFGISSSLISNGILLSKWSCILKKHGGLSTIFLSVDSNIKKLHNEIRGINCLSSIESALKKDFLSQRIVLNTVLSRMNYDNLDNLTNWMRSHGIKYINPIPMKHTSLSLSDLELRKCLLSLVTECNLAGVKMYTEGINDSFITPQQAMKHLTGNLPKACYVGRSTLFIDVDGNCYPCNSSSRRSPELCLGNVFKLQTSLF